MSDRELSTRDLTARSETPEEQQDAETDATDEPIARERSETEGGNAASTAQTREPLLADDQSASFTERWREIQVGFVDEPRESVAKADTLVAHLMQQLAASFSEERERLEKQWDSGDDVSTEDLRLALTRYRSFFDRLLSA